SYGNARAIRKAPASSAIFHFGFNGIPDECGDIGTAETFHFPDSGGRGDVYLRQVIADHVDAGEDEAALFQLRAEGVANVFLAVAETRGLGSAADMPVGARLAFGRHAVDGAGEFAIDQDDALVALADFRDVALHDHRFAIELGEHFEQASQILVIRFHP